ncbi:uncharacterized protein [Procambarus clarkii]|uniref:uncharacterized protein n=1 Tax=Procambarus clarkii TaxID=6728 RepID=UPI001E675C48|nr:uncharacterized protein LOC123756826 [Procambarus clarkii]
MAGGGGHGYTEGGLSLLPLQMASSSTPGVDSVCKQTLGSLNDLPNKVVFLLGDDLEMKASVKDAFVNYIFDVQVRSTYRLILADNFAFEDVQDIIYVYIFNQTGDMSLPFNLVFVDVPPLGYSGGTERDVRILQDLEGFLQQEFGTTMVDAVSFVVQTSTDILLPLVNTYELLCCAFDDLESITQVLVTDPTSYMPLLNSLKKANIAYNNLFIFDNGEKTTAHISPEEHFFLQIFRLFDYHGVDDFFQELKSSSPLRMSLGKQLEDGLVDVTEISRLRVIHQFTEVVGHHEGLDLRQLVMKLDHRDDGTRVMKLTLGDTNDKPTKVVLLVGDRESGKTTLATAMVNYIFGVKFHDNFRLLINGDPLNRLTKDLKIKKTKFTTAYSFNILPRPHDHHNLIIVDTPGLGSPEEHAHNKHIMSRLATLLRKVCGLHHFDIIGFVIPAKIQKLPDSYRSVYKHLYSLLTDEGREKIIIMATQSDAKRPPVIDAINKLSLPFARGLKFNSHSVLTDVTTEHQEADNHRVISELYWKIEQCNLFSLFAELRD